MKIVDYANNQTLSDVEIVLTAQEAEDLLAYLQQLTRRPGLDRVYLSDLSGGLLQRELVVSLDNTCCA
ncbi:MAG: hypothetical protein JST35_11060 [Armatimonadetes bacterium]|jgi:hypothetical protein|nr:hypothetical protein [Armatimonadota bacterium]